MHHSITVIFFTAFGENVSCDFKTEEKNTGNLKELVVYVPYKPSGNSLLNRIRYNIHYYRFARTFLAGYFARNGRPVLVHVHVPVKAGNLAIWIKNKFGINYFLSEHTSTYLKEAPDNFFTRHYLYRWQVKRVFGGAELVINVSDAVLKILQGLFPIKKTTVIPNVVDTELFRWNGDKDEVFTFIHVSSLGEQKNIPGILQSFAVLSRVRKDWKLVLVGPYTPDVEANISSHGLAGLVELKGEVSYQQVALFMRRAHVKVLFSNHENFPCVVVEALCCGLLVVSSDVAGIKEAVNASNGILVSRGNTEALVEALLSIRENYAQFNTMEIAMKAASAYGYPVIAKQFDDIYQPYDAS